MYRNMFLHQAVNYVLCTQKTATRLNHTHFTLYPHQPLTLYAHHNFSPVIIRPLSLGCPTKLCNCILPAAIASVLTPVPRVKKERYIYIYIYTYIYICICISASICMRILRPRTNKFLCVPKSSDCCLLGEACWF